MIAPTQASLALPDLSIQWLTDQASRWAPPRSGLDDMFAAALKAFEVASFKSRARSNDRAAIVAAYAARNSTPIWIDGDHWSAAARSVVDRLKRAAEDGLDLGPVAIPELGGTPPDGRAVIELALSEAVVAYGREAGGSRVDPLRINRLITAKRTIAEPAQILASVASAPDPGMALQAYNPQQPGYQALRAKLSELRGQATTAALQSGAVGAGGARVPLRRSRLGLDLASKGQRRGVAPDTEIAGTISILADADEPPELSGPSARRLDNLSVADPTRLEIELIANMERWRWLPRDLGDAYIGVNIPDYSLDVVRDGEVVHHARVIVGKPDHQTPVFSDLMRFVIVNPYWNVPLSIIRKEMLPKLADDPDYFASHGYEVVERDGMTYVRQPPGEENALGRIKFMFPNEHSVYLHDTNARALFGKGRRAFSHGCVRVDQPFKLAEVVLGRQNGWPETRIKALVGGDERTIKLPRPLPIHINYFTAFVDGTGGLQLRDDVYGYSAKVEVALGLRD